MFMEATYLDSVEKSVLAGGVEIEASADKSSDLKSKRRSQKALVKEAKAKYDRAKEVRATWATSCLLDKGTSRVPVWQ